MPLGPAELNGPGAPTRDERKRAKYSRDAERIRYARQRQPIQFGKTHCTQTESEIGIEMIRRHPGLSFEQALAMLRRPR